MRLARNDDGGKPLRRLFLSIARSAQFRRHRDTIRRISRIIGAGEHTKSLVKAKGTHRKTCDNNSLLSVRLKRRLVSLKDRD